MWYVGNTIRIYPGPERALILPLACVSLHYGIMIAFAMFFENNALGKLQTCTHLNPLVSLICQALYKAASIRAMLLS